jgi:RNA polymerase sigma factor (sigma-70 family)
VSRSSRLATGATPRKPCRTPSSRRTAHSAGSARAPFRPWLLRIVANEARNKRRSAGRRSAVALRAAEAQASGDAAPSPEAAALSHERRDALLGALASLGERDRDVLVHRFLLDLGEDEKAAALGIRRGTVKSRTSRALERTRAAVPEVVS